MLKVIIADDEERVCRLVQALADWNALGMEVAGTAANGLEALELVKKIKPDILITDIRMPGCYGLELIQRAKEYLPQLEIIIISGYAHFEYAQSAIKFGVGDYLLKPIQKEELRATLQKLGDRCRERQKSMLEAERLRYSTEDVDRLQKRLILDLAAQRLAAPTMEQLRQEYHVEVREGQFQVVLLKIDYDPDQLGPASLDIIWEKAEKIFRGALPPLCYASIMDVQKDCGVAVLNYPQERQAEVRRRCRDGLNQLVAQSPMFGPVTFSVALGQPVGRAEEIPLSLKDAVGAVKERLIEGSGRLLEGNPPDSQLQDAKLFERYGKSVELLLDTLSLQEADAIVDQLQQNALQVPGVRGRELIDLVCSCGELFALRLSGADGQSDSDSFRARCMRCSRAADLFGCLRDFQQKLLEQVLLRRKDESQRPIRIAKQYIQQHYSENITLEDVSRASGFSVSYFSALFKRETGEGFAKYLTKIRMERAKELLQETNLPVSVICSQVGYGDLKHFNQIFKKTTSLSPGQYRKLYG